MKSRPNFTAAVFLVVTAELFVLDMPLWVIAPFTLVTALLLLGAVFDLISWAYMTFAVEKPSEETPLASVDEAEVWLMQRGFTIAHTCEARGGHVVGRKPSSIPFLTVSLEIWIEDYPDEVYTK